MSGWLRPVVAGVWGLTLIRNQQVVGRLFSVLGGGFKEGAVTCAGWVKMSGSIYFTQFERDQPGRSGIKWDGHWLIELN